MASYGSVPTATATPVAPIMVEVEAPSTLEAGYTFDAVFDGVTFPVAVPAGGVKQGQKLVVPFVTTSSGGGAASDDKTPMLLIPGDAPPQGQWKDGMCDCFRFGFLHPSFLNAWCCPQILMAQVLTRMKMDFLGNPPSSSSSSSSDNTFFKIVVLVVIFCVVTTILAPSPDVIYDEETGEIQDIVQPPTSWRTIVNHILGLCFGFYTIVVLYRLRKAVRARYQIPEQRCFGYEDACTAAFCTCCTVSQLARETANYEERRAVCCSNTGLTPSAPVLDV